MEYKPKQWRNHYLAPVNGGRPILMLNIDELKLAGNLLLRYLSVSHFSENPDDFTSSIKLSPELKNKIFVSAKRQINKLSGIDDDVFPHHLLDNLNEDLNTIFSNECWKKIRLEISQIKKRNKKLRIEVSKDLVKKLNNIRQLNSLRSYDEVIDYLISAYVDSNDTKELNEPKQAASSHQ
jgi:hypothetical protein